METEKINNKAKLLHSHNKGLLGNIYRNPSGGGRLRKTTLIVDVQWHSSLFPCRMNTLKVYFRGTANAVMRFCLHVIVAFWILLYMDACQMISDVFLFLPGEHSNECLMIVIFCCYVLYVLSYHEKRDSLLHLTQLHTWNKNMFIFYFLLFSWFIKWKKEIRLWSLDYWDQCNSNKGHYFNLRSCQFSS